MKNTVTLSVIAVVAISWLTFRGSVWAEDNTSLIVNGVATNIGADLTIGVSGTNNSMQILNGGSVTNVEGKIGGGASANYNFVIVTNSGSVWYNTSFLRPGYVGDSNQLVIVDGGKVVAVGTLVGDQLAAQYNTVLVTGTNSVLTNSSTLWVGNAGGHSQLTITNGGKVYSANGVLGNGVSSVENLVKVTGTGSLWASTASDVTIGSAVGSTNNTLLVTDGGLVTIAGTLFPGGGGDHNQVIITNGGKIASGQGLLGSSASGSNNTVLITGTGSMWTNSSTAIFIGGSGSANQLTVEAGGSLYSSNGVMGNTASSSNNLLVVTGSGSLYKNVNDFSLSGGGSNTLLITSGGSVNSGNFQFFNKNNQVIITNGGTAQIVTTIMGNSTSVTGSRIVVTGTGSVLNASFSDYAFLVAFNGASTSTLQIDNGGVANATAGRLYLGGYAALASSSNTVLVTGAGSQFNLGSDVFLGWGGASTSIDNQLTIANGGVLKAGGASYLGYTSANSNIVTVTGTGSVYSNTANDFFPNYGGVGNQLIITNGGKVASLNGRMGTGGGSAGLVKVTGSGSVWTNIGGVFIGENSLNNALQVENGGQLYTTTLNAGFGTGSGNSILVTGGGLVEMTNLVANAPAGNTISNVGGVYQFFSGTPTVTPNGAGRIALTGGTISYRSVTNADVVNAQVANIAFAGNNTFRLNSASNSLSGQTYTFNTGLGAANYTRLEMINGETAYRGGTVTIGSGGMMLISNTTAKIEGVLTNLGAFSSVNSKATFASAVVNSGTWNTDPTTNTFNNTYTVTSSGAITMTPGDVMIFNSDFVNVSTNNTGYNTLDGKFLFTGGATTQRFYTAGHELGQAPTPATPTARLPGNDIGFTNNFALGVLELSNFTTVRVSDAFITGGPGTNDNLRAALYLNNLFIDSSSFLIVDTNVTVYFASSNGWSAANFTLLGDGELHQIFIPEPSVLLLAVGGSALVAWRRQKRRRSS